MTGVHGSIDFTYGDRVISVSLTEPGIYPSDYEKVIVLVLRDLERMVIAALGPAAEQDAEGIF